MWFWGLVGMEVMCDSVRHPRDEIDGGLLPMLFFLLLFLWLDCKFWKTISRDILRKHAGNASVIQILENDF
jgi:hypothetical protein